MDFIFDLFIVNPNKSFKSGFWIWGLEMQSGLHISYLEGNLGSSAPVSIPNSQGLQQACRFKSCRN